MTLSTGEIKNILIGIVNMLDYAERISQQPNCNTCTKAASCKYTPKPGQPVRINCPHWTNTPAQQPEAANE